MKDQKRGRVEYIIGVLIIAIALGIGFYFARKISIKFATEFGYIFIIAPLIIGLIIGLFSGLLIFSGYSRILDEQE